MTRQRPTILKLLASENQSPLVRRDTLLVPNLCLNVADVDCVAGGLDLNAVYIPLLLIMGFLTKICTAKKGHAMAR